MQNLLSRALRKSHVNGATKLKLYSCIGIRKYLSVCQNFSARGASEGAGPPDVHLGSPNNISDTTRVRKMKLNIQLHVIKYSLWVQKQFPLGGVQGVQGP